MVSRIDPPAVSVAVTRMVTSAPADALKTARNWPPPAAASDVTRQDFPSLNDTCTRAPVTCAALAS
jgi:hypothetical protein